MEQDVRGYLREREMLSDSDKRIHVKEDAQESSMISFIV